MRRSAQRLGRVLYRAAGVLVIGALLAGQHVSVGPLARHATGEGARDGCTEQACHCGADCTCAHCDQHGENADPGTDGLSFRSCGGPSQGPAGVFAVSKSLVAPGSLLHAAPRSPKHSASHSPESLASQRRGSRVFRPPKPRVG